MVWFDYGITPGVSVANPRNVESFLKYPPTVNPDQPVPSVAPIAEITLDQNAQFNGTLIHVWYWSAMSIANFQTYMQWVFGGYTTGSIAVSIKTRSDQETFLKYNCIAIRPIIGQDYQRGYGQSYRDVRMTFRGLVSYV